MAPHRPRIALIRAEVPHTTAWYYLRAFRRLGVDLVDLPFRPGKKPEWKSMPGADLALLIDCGLPVDFPALERFGGAKGFVSIDSCHKLPMHHTLCDRYSFDFIWVAQKHVAKDLGSNARWLPLAAEPETHACRPGMAGGPFLDRLLRRSHYDIAMCGAPYGHRRRFEKLFRRAGLSARFLFRKRFGLDATRELARATIGFNAGAGFDGKRGMDMNMRVFETMANGQCMLLTNTYEGLGYEDLFTEGRHYIGFRTEAEAVQKALYYASRPEEAIAIAREGQRRVLQNHTYVHRCGEILSSFLEGRKVDLHAEAERERA